MSNPQHVPSEKDQATVKMMAFYGINQEDIAFVIGISPKTLRLHYDKELRSGSIEAKTAVGRSLFQMATKGENVTAAIFYAKTRMGWSERPDSDADAPITVRIVGGLPDALDNLSDASG